jgi:hypothetical protein
MKKLLLGLFAIFNVALAVWCFHLANSAPAEMMQGDEYRIIFYHVPSASVAFLFFAISMAGSIGYLTLHRKNPTLALAWDGWAVSGAEVGIVFCTVVLVTGPLWGYRAWGIWWTWDPRLTTTLLLWLIYVSYLLLRRFAGGAQMHTSSAVLGIFGVRRRRGIGHGPGHPAPLPVEHVCLDVLGFDGADRAPSTRTEATEGRGSRSRAGPERLINDRLILDRLIQYLPDSEFR